MITDGLQKEDVVLENETEETEDVAVIESGGVEYLTLNENLADENKTITPAKLAGVTRKQIKISLQQLHKK